MPAGGGAAPRSRRAHRWTLFHAAKQGFVERIRNPFAPGGNDGRICDAIDEGMASSWPGKRAWIMGAASIGPSQKDANASPG